MRAPRPPATTELKRLADTGTFFLPFSLKYSVIERKIPRRAVP
jgi:hypothetical protein